MSAVSTIWVLFGTALIFFMQAGFAMVEAGFTRAKNAGNIIMKNLLDMCIGGPLFWFLGFGIMFGSTNPIFGSIDFFSHGSFAAAIPEGISKWTFLAFETMFCATSATIVSGAMAERTKFSAYCSFSVVLTLLIYPLAGHWIWGGGFLQQLGFHDLAGSTAVHMVGGTAAFMGAKLLGPRIGKYSKNGNPKAIPGHNITLGALGVFILWFCWFGFNGSSTVSMEGDAIAMVGKIFVNTNLSAALAVVSSMFYTWIRYKKPDVSVSLNGALAGLVAITSGCDVMSPTGAAITGVLAGLCVAIVIEIMDSKIKVDDPVGAVAVHGACGLLGTIATGLFSQSEGLIYGKGAGFLAVQILGAVVILVWVSISSYIALKIIDKTLGLRVSKREEIEGLDTSEHGLNNAYADFLPSILQQNGAEDERLIAKPDVPIDQAIPVNMGNISSGNMNGSVLTKVEIICKQAKFEDLKEAMNKIGVTGMTVTQVMGCGVQKGATEYYRGIPMDVQLLPKMRVEIVIAKVPVTDVVNEARKVLYTGHIGDGKIFIYDVRDALKVRTGETGYDAMQGIEILS